MPELVSVLFGREEIRRRIEEIGRTITGDYEGREPVMISVLKGGSVFLGDLIREISLPLSIDYMSISRYGGAAESMGRVRIVKDLDGPGVARSGIGPGVRAARQVRATHRAARDPLSRLRMPGRVRRRVRSGLPGTLSEHP
jgi:hypothetical protein